MIIPPCPECGQELTYEKIFNGTPTQPPEPEQLFCEYCDWYCEDFDYITQREDLC